MHADEAENEALRIFERSLAPGPHDDALDRAAVERAMARLTARETLAERLWRLLSRPATGLAALAGISVIVLVAVGVRHARSTAGAGGSEGCVIAAARARRRIRDRAGRRAERSSGRRADARPHDRPAPVRRSALSCSSRSAASLPRRHRRDSNRGSRDGFPRRSPAGRANLRRRVRGPRGGAPSGEPAAGRARCGRRGRLLRDRFATEDRSEERTAPAGSACGLARGEWRFATTAPRERARGSPGFRGSGPPIWAPADGRRPVAPPRRAIPVGPARAFCRVHPGLGVAHGSRSASGSGRRVRQRGANRAARRLGGGRSGTCRGGVAKGG